MSFATLLWLFPVVIALHNLEEAIWLPRWATRTGFWRASVSPGLFRFVVTVLTAVTFAITWLSATSGPQTFWTYLLFGCVVAALANAIFPHLVLSVARRSYMPGTATAVALNLPVLSFLAASAVAERQVAGWRSVAYAAGVPVLVLVLLAAFFKPGKWILQPRAPCGVGLPACPGAKRRR